MLCVYLTTIKTTTRTGKICPREHSRCQSQTQVGRLPCPGSSLLSILGTEVTSIKPEAPSPSRTSPHRCVRGCGFQCGVYYQQEWAVHTGLSVGESVRSNRMLGCLGQTEEQCVGRSDSLSAWGPLKLRGVWERGLCEGGCTKKPHLMRGLGGANRRRGTASLTSEGTPRGARERPERTVPLYEASDTLLWAGNRGSGW